MTIHYDVPPYTQRRGEPVPTHEFEGRVFTFSQHGPFGAEWRAADGALLFLDRGKVTAFEHGDRWCSLIEAVDGVAIAPVYGRKGQDIADDTVRAWIAGRGA